MNLLAIVEDEFAAGRIGDAPGETAIINRAKVGAAAHSPPQSTHLPIERSP